MSHTYALLHVPAQFFALVERKLAEAGYPAPENGEIDMHGLALVADPTEELSVPTPYSTWQHKNGTEYTVLLIANADSDKAEYPVTVVYQGPNGKVWSRPLSEWYRSMRAKV